MLDENTRDDDMNGNNKPVSDRPSNEPVEAEYHYVRPKNGHECIDAGYISKDEAPPVPRYRYVEPEKEKKERNPGGGFIRLIAACLICAILGGLAGGGLTWYLRGANAGPLEAAESPQVSQSQNSPVPSTIASNDGALSGTQIYELGCQQTVGVTTEVTTRNVFGQISTSSVAGSGFVIRPDGHIITNYHVIEAAYQNGLEVKVFLNDGTEHHADILGVEMDNDIAVLKIDAENLSAVALGDSDAMSVGEMVYALGNPLGELTYTMTTGSISALNREIRVDSQNRTIKMFQIDAAVNSGNSGGPLFDDHGKVIGIITAKYQASGIEGLGFAIPINDAIHIADSIIENGYVTGKAFLGITPKDVSASEAAYFNMVEGVFVRSITAGSCSESAGLKVGDIITNLGGKSIMSTVDLSNALRDYHSGDTAAITINRDGQSMELSVTFDEYPAPSEQTNTQTPEPTPGIEIFEEFPYIEG